MTEQANLKRTLSGVVVSNKMDKTVVVLVERKLPHPKYGKYVTRRSKLFAHDEKNICQIGDKIIIQESRPLSKNKNWVLLEVVNKQSQIGENS